MPNVPNLPGVPVLSSYSALSVVALVFNDAINLLAGSLSPQWGLFQNGIPVVVCDSVNAFDYRNSSVVSDYPQEDGSFTSYDKVQSPYEVKFRFVTGGSVANREEMLASIQSISKNTQLYDAVTPEQVYTNCNITHVAYRRTNANGNGLLIIDVGAEEIRVTAEAAFVDNPQQAANSTGSGSTSNGANTNSSGAAPVAPITTPQAPAAVSPVNDGTVQTTAPTQQETSFVPKFTDALSGALGTI
jgi:hypothetical protein